MKTKRTGQIGRSRPDKEWIYGLNPVREAIRAGREIEYLLILPGRYNRLREGLTQEAELRRIPIRTADHDYFEHMFGKGHQGVAAAVSGKKYLPLDELLDIPVTKNETPLFVVLDCLEDPRNFGAILRVADAADAHGVVIQSHRSAVLSSGVSKSSAGAVEHVPVSMVSNIKYAIREMKVRGITVLGTDPSADDLLWEVDLTGPLALVIGSEGRGLRKTVMSSCDALARIPMGGKINSLNVSVAAGIFAFEILRQRRKKSHK